MLVKKINIIIYMALFILMSPSHVLAGAKTYICDYSTYSDQEGNHKVKEEFKLTFVIDNETGKSYILGNAGTEDVHKIENETRIAFIEITATGNVMTTAIDASLNSVHSRNSIILGEMLPSQYYGLCIIK